MHSRRFAAAFFTLLTAFAITAYVLPLVVVRAEGAASGKQCPAEEKNKKEYQPAKPWNTSYKEKRGDTVYTILNLFGKPCKDVTNEEVVTGHCIREDTCKADKTAEGKKPQTCLETKECPPGSNVGDTQGGADENEELPYYEEPKPDNSDGVLPLKEEPTPDPSKFAPSNTFDERFAPIETKQESPLKTLWDAAQTFFNPQTPKLEDSTMTGFGPQQTMQPVPDNGVPGGSGQSLLQQAFYNKDASFGDPPAPAAETPAAPAPEQTWGEWFAEKYESAKSFFTGEPTPAPVADESGEVPAEPAAPQKDLTDPYATQDDVDALKPKTEPFKDYGTLADQIAPGIGGTTDQMREIAETKREQLEAVAEYDPQEPGDRERLQRDMKTLDDQITQHNKGPACAPSCSQSQIDAYRARGDALNAEQKELLTERDRFNQLVSTDNFIKGLNQPLTPQQLAPFTGPGPQSDQAWNVANAERAALQEIAQQRVDAFWNNTDVAQPDLVKEQNRIANNAFEAAGNNVTPEMQRQAYQDLTRVADARDDRTIESLEQRLAAVREQILNTPDNWQTMDPMMGVQTQDSGRAALEREAAALEKQIQAGVERQEVRDRVRDFLDENPYGNKAGEVLLNTKSPAVAAAMTDAINKYQIEAERLERFDSGINIDSKVSNWINNNLYGGYDDVSRSIYTDTMQKYEGQVAQLVGDQPMTSTMQNKLDTLAGNYSTLQAGAYAVQDYLRDATNLETAADKPYFVVTGPAAFLASGVVDPLTNITVGTREYYLTAPDRSTWENFNAVSQDVVFTALNATMIPGVASKLGGALAAAEARTFGEIASIGEGAASINAYTRVASEFEPTFASAGSRAGAAITQDGVSSGALAAARDIAPFEANSFRAGSEVLTPANSNARTLYAGNDNFAGGPSGGGARTTLSGGDDVVAAGRTAEGVSGSDGVVASLADARAAAAARAETAGSTFVTDGNLAVKTDAAAANRSAIVYEGEPFQANRFTTADAALARGNAANDNVLGAPAPRVTAPATAPATVPYGEYGYRPVPVTSPTWYQPADNTLYSQLSPSGNLASSFPDTAIPSSGYAQPVSYAPTTPAATQYTPARVAPVSPIAPSTPGVDPSPAKFVTPSEYIRRTYGDAAGRAAEAAQAYGASPFDWANYLGAGGGAGGAKDAGSAPSTVYPQARYTPTATVRPIVPNTVPKTLAEQAVSLLKEAGVLPGATVETHPSQYPKELFDHETNVYYQRLGDGRYLAQNFETGAADTMPANNIGDLIEASRYTGNLEIAPGVFLKEPIAAESTFGAAIENGLGIAPTAQVLAERAGVTNGARPIATTRTINPDIAPEHIPLVEVKNVPGSRDLRSLDYPEALALREYQSGLANYSKALASGADVSRSAELVTNAYERLQTNGIFTDDEGNLYRIESPAYPIAVPISPQMAGQAAYAVVVPVDAQVREFVTGSTDETFAFDVPDLRILSSNFGVQPPINSEEAIILQKANDILKYTRSRESLLYLFENNNALRVRPQDGFIVRGNGEIVARPEGLSAVPGALPERFVPAGPVPPLPVQLVKTETTPLSNGKTNEIYEAVDYSGRRIAGLKVTINGTVATVDAIQAFRPGQSSWTAHTNALGAATIRSLLNQFRAAHPEVTAIAGQRMSGARFAGVWDPADVGQPVEIGLPEVPAETVAAAEDVPTPSPYVPARFSAFDPVALALGVALTVGSPVPMNSIADAIGDGARFLSTAAEAGKIQVRPGRPSAREIAWHERALKEYVGEEIPGIASWYGTGSNGGTNPSNLTASGAWHRNDVFTVAMLGGADELPWGTVLLVKNNQEFLKNPVTGKLDLPNPNYGKEVRVVVTSTGSQPDRDLDLSPAARDALGIGEEGFIPVKYIIESIPDVSDIGYWKGRKDLDSGGGPVPKGTYDTRLAEVKGNPTIAVAAAKPFSGQPAVAGTNGKRSAIDTPNQSPLSKVLGAIVKGAKSPNDRALEMVVAMEKANPNVSGIDKAIRLELEGLRDTEAFAAQRDLAARQIDGAGAASDDMIARVNGAITQAISNIKTNQSVADVLSQRGLVPKGSIAQKNADGSYKITTPAGTSYKLAQSAPASTNRLTLDPIKKYTMGDLRDMNAPELARFIEAGRGIQNDRFITGDMLAINLDIINQFYNVFKTVPQINGIGRSAAVNRAVGGVEGSDHLTGNATDWKTVGVAEKQKAELLRLLQEKGLGLVTHVHGQGPHYHASLDRAATPVERANLNVTENKPVQYALTNASGVNMGKSIALGPPPQIQTFDPSLAFVAPDLPSMIATNVTYTPQGTPNWQLPTPQITVTAAEPLEASPVPNVERGPAIEQPLPTNVVVRGPDLEQPIPTGVVTRGPDLAEPIPTGNVTRGADLPEPGPANPIARVDRGPDLAPPPATVPANVPIAADTSLKGSPAPAALSPQDNVTVSTQPNANDQSRVQKALSRTAEAIKNLDSKLLTDTAVKSFKKIAASIGLGPKDSNIVPEVKTVPFDAEPVPGSELSYVCGSGAACAEKTSDAVLVRAEPGRTFAHIEAADKPVVPASGEKVLAEHDAKFLARAAGGFVTTSNNGRAIVSQDITYSAGKLIGSKTINPNSSQGLVLADGKGNLRIVDKNAIPARVLQELGADLGSVAPTEVLSASKDFAKFDQIMRDNKLSAFTNLLLIKDGVIQNVQSSIAEPRRLLLEMTDGRLAILNSTKDQTMLGITQIAKALGAKNAVNLDTGAYNEGRVAVQSGDAPFLGSTVKTQALTNIYLGIRNTPLAGTSDETIPTESAPPTRPLEIPQDQGLSGSPDPSARTAPVPQVPAPGPVESLGVNTRRPEFEASPATSPVASNDNTPRRQSNVVPLSPIPNNRALTAFAPEPVSPSISDFQRPTLYANSQGGIWPTVDGAREALILEGEILPPAPVGRSDSQVGQQKPALDLGANTQSIAPTLRPGASSVQSVPENGLTAPSQVQRIAYTGSNTLGQPKVVLNLDILGNEGLVSMRSVNDVTIPSVEEIESLLRQLSARHPEVESFIAAAPAREQVIVMRDGSGDAITVTSAKQLPLSPNSPVQSMLTIPISDIPPGTTFTAPKGSVLAYRWIKGDVDVDFFNGTAVREFDNPYFSSDLVSPLMYVMDSKNNIAAPTANLIVIALPERTFFDAAIYSLIESMRRPTNPDALNVMSRVNFPLTMHSGAAIPHEWLEAESDSAASLRRVEFVANYPGLFSEIDKSELYAALKRLAELDTESAQAVFSDIGKSLKEYSFDDLAAVEDYRVDNPRYEAHDGELARLAGPFTDALSRIGTIPRSVPGPETVPLPQNRSLVVNRPPVNVLPALENILLTGPTLYVNGRGEIWPSLASAEIDINVREIVAQIRSEQIIDTGIRAIVAQIGAEKTIDTGIAQIANQVGAEKIIDTGIKQIANQVGAEKTIDDGIAQIAKQVGTQKKIDDAMKAIVNPEQAIDDGIADIVSRIQPGEGAQPARTTSVPNVPAPRLAGEPVTPSRVLEEAIRNFAANPVQQPRVTNASPRPDVALPPPLPGPTFTERAKNIWSDTKLATRVARGVVFPASTIRRNAAVNTLNMIVAYNLTGPYTVLTWPALNVGWRYVFNKDYRADVNNVASRISSALADARAERAANKARQDLLSPEVVATDREPQFVSSQSVPQVRAPEVSLEDGMRAIVDDIRTSRPTPEAIVDDGIAEIASNIRPNPTPETIIDEGIAEIASNVRGTPPRAANDLDKSVAEFAADHPSLTNGNAPVQKPVAADPLTQTVGEFAADKPKIEQTNIWDNLLEWFRRGGGGTGGGSRGGGDGSDGDTGNGGGIRAGLLSVARLIPGLSSLINSLPVTAPQTIPATNAPLDGSPQNAGKPPVVTPPATTPAPKPNVVAPKPGANAPVAPPPPAGPAARPVAPDTSGRPDSAPTGGTNAGGGGMGSLSSLLSGLMKGLGLGQPKPIQPQQQQPRPNGGITVEITARPNPVASGETVLVSWTSVNASTCSAFNASSTKVATGAPGAMFSVPSVTAPTTYKVYCSNALGQYASATVQILMK